MSGGDGAGILVNPGKPNFDVLGGEAGRSEAVNEGGIQAKFMRACTKRHAMLSCLNSHYARVLRNLACPSCTNVGQIRVQI